MNRDEIRSIVGEIAAEIFEMDRGDISDDADFHNDLGGDSLQRLELIVALEKRFNIHYIRGDEAQMNSINDVVDITEKYATQ